MSFFRYPGGKSKLRKPIIKRLLAFNFKEYREPFFGAGFIGTHLLSIIDNANISVWVNDKDIGIASLWTSVINQPNELKKKILGFTPSVDKYYETKIRLENISEKSSPLEIGFDKLVIHQTSFSGLGLKSGSPLGGKSQISKYKIDCRWSPKHLTEKIDELHHTLSKFLIVENKCTNYDFETLLGNTSSIPCLLYLDPPYYEKGGELYIHSFSDEAHISLANMLQCTNHNWLLSYDDCEFIRNQYKWATIEPIDITYSINKSRSKSELLISKELNKCQRSTNLFG